MLLSRCDGCRDVTYRRVGRVGVEEREREGEEEEEETMHDMEWRHGGMAC